jgi:hypothetical protein
MIQKRSVRSVKKVLIDGVWNVALPRKGTRYIWDERPGSYFLDWHEAGHRRREHAGMTPAQAVQAQKRKQRETSLVREGCHRPKGPRVARGGALHDLIV